MPPRPADHCHNSSAPGGVSLAALLRFGCCGGPPSLLQGTITPRSSAKRAQSPNRTDPADRIHTRQAPKCACNQASAPGASGRKHISPPWSTPRICSSFGTEPTMAASATTTAPHLGSASHCVAGRMQLCLLLHMSSVRNFLGGTPLALRNHQRRSQAHRIQPRAVLPRRHSTRP